MRTSVSGLKPRQTGGPDRRGLWLKARMGLADRAHAAETARMPGSSALLIAAVERSKAPFFVAGGVLVVWALASAALGTRRASFPGRAWASPPISRRRRRSSS